MFFMPPEWHPHERTWMSWPVPGYTLDAGAEAAHRAWSAVANTIVRYEPVTMVVDPGERESAARWLAPEVEVMEQPLDDCWMRDNGPTFLVDGAGGLAGVDWTFNGWGWHAHAKDDLVAAAVLERAGATRFRSEMVNEGGGIHVDGEGTVIVTETVQLGERRNPGWTRERVEAELRDRIGARKVIWLPRGLTADYGRYGTSGHVDLLACFARPGLALCHVQPDPDHPDHEVTRENLRILRSATDARGRALEVVELPAPETREVDGELVDYSYINHYLANGLALLCSFGDPRDAAAAEVFARLFPGRAIETVDARPIFALGGGIHCITQQQPRP
ncbi:putative agmatine deiminase [Streptosporangium pseudovulgare]|uniref:Agmatine deiminase n=2 Tax=Streptosporangium pseudovulgare TaxID=35765 RepID=A0ABQ2R0Q5_9ACTN|nr:putative agmatine deiminase [Streptosporangium pseudovulgare]